jgi:4-hydroxy-3-methylbut-2-enyl diphosphate reductase
VQLIVRETAGFCQGIASAVKSAEKILDQLQGKAYSLGAIAHNKEVINKLSEKGLVIIDDIEELAFDAKHLIIRAHGTTKETYQKVKEKKLKLFDLTCPKVLAIHRIVEKHVLDDYFIFYTGEHGHPEVVSTSSFCGDNYLVINKKEDIADSIKTFIKSNKEKALIISQTTFNLELFNAISNGLKNEIGSLEKTCRIESSICDATKLRQEETIKIASEVDAMIIVGGKHSSNTQKLYHISLEKCGKAIHVETAQELDVDDYKLYNKVGIMAGASTPQSSIDEVVEIFKKIVV